MMGKDCERMLKSINMIKDELMNSISTILSSISNPIEMEEYHITSAYPVVDESIHLNETINMKEKPNPVSVSLGNVVSLMDEFSVDGGKMKTLEEGIYTSTDTFNNSYGSPWSEIHRLENAVDLIKDKIGGSTEYTIEKVGLLMVIINAVTCAIDAKWALTTYHDYVQRGFDAKFNDKTPSISFKTVQKVDSLGNIDQDFDENVNVPRRSIDPF